MKLFRNAIILVVVVALLIGAYYFLSNRPSGDDGPANSTETKVERVISVEKDKISSLEYNSEKGTYKLLKKDNQWTVEPGMEFPLDEATATAASEELSSIIAQKVIEENASDLSKYGLDKPSATMKVGLEDGTINEIEVGNLSPTGDGLYVKNKGSNKVFLIASSYEESFKQNKGHFAVKEILPVEATSVSAITYEKNGQVQFALDIKSSAETLITAPVEEKADSAEVEKMTNAVVQLEIWDIVDDNPDLAKYGLDKPRFSIEYSDGTTTKKILFGKQLDKGYTAYAKLADSKSVFTIDISPLTFLDMKFSDLVEPFVFIPNIKDVSKVELTMDGKTTVSEINTVEDDSDKDTFKVDGKDATMKNDKDKSLFRNFYQGLIGITFDRYETGLTPTGNPEITIKYHMKTDSKPVIIELIPKDEFYYYAMKNGVFTNRIVLKAKLQEEGGLRPTYKELMEAIDKAGK